MSSYCCNHHSLNHRVFKTERIYQFLRMLSIGWISIKARASFFNFFVLGLRILSGSLSAGRSRVIPSFNGGEFPVSGTCDQIEQWSVGTSVYQHRLNDVCQVQPTEATVDKLAPEG